MNSDNCISVGKDVKDEVYVRISDSVGWYVFENVDGRIDWYIGGRVYSDIDVETWLKVMKKLIQRLNVKMILKMIVV